MSTGYVVMCDIVEFSEKAPDEQKRCVRDLANWLSAYLGQFRWAAREPYVNSTGDGFLLATKEDAVRGRKDKSQDVKVTGDGAPDLDAAEWCLGLARDVLAFRDTYNDRRKGAALGIRLAINRGTYVPKFDAFSGKHAVGLALNQCSRLLKWSDDGQVIVSQKFRDHLAQKKYGDSYISRDFDRFKPTRTGIEVPIKHERLALIYQYVGAADEPGCGALNTSPPRKIVVLDTIHKNIFAELRVACELVEQHLSGVGYLGPRASIFSPTSDSQHLRVTTYRFRPDSKVIADSSTTYAICNGNVQGPVGIAFTRKRPAIVVGLPAPHPDNARYTAAVCNASTIDGVPLRLTRNDISGPKLWTRKAQSFIAVPVAISGLDPVAALCVDLRAPLDQVPHERLNNVAAELQARCALSLAGLMEVRKGG